MSNVSERVSPAKTPMRFAFAADGNVIPGVHVTVASLLQSLTFPDDVELHLFYTNWTDAQIESLSRTAQLNNRRSTLYCHRLDLQPFRSLRPVRGSIMNFAWFVIPEFFDDRVIILDTDLVVTIDLTPLASVALDDTKLCAAVSWRNLEQAPNWPIYAECGMAPNGPALLGGGLAVHAHDWKARNITNKCLSLRTLLQKRLCGGNQPILNIALYEKFQILERKYNTPISPSQGKLSEDVLAASRVWHFVGRPKPWEFLGCWVHSNSFLYQTYLKKTDIVRDGGGTYSVNVSRSARTFIRYHRAYFRRMFFWARR